MERIERINDQNDELVDVTDEELVNILKMFPFLKQTNKYVKQRILLGSQQPSHYLEDDEELELINAKRRQELIPLEKQ